MRKIIITPLISLLFLIFASCSRDYSSYTGKIWGTEFHIVYSCGNNLDSMIMDEMRRVDASLSAFNKESVVSRINRSEDVSADEYFTEVFRISQTAHRLSGGAFDPTVRPLVNAWGFGDTDAGAAPSPQELDSLLTLVGLDGCAIDASGHVHKKNEDTMFDFSAVAKGYGVDRIADLLRENGCGDYLVEIGGEVSLAGKNPRGKPWRIQIDAPLSEPGADGIHSRLAVIEPGEGPVSLATSGNYRNWRTDSVGERYGHTISARTGKPVQTEILSATVIASSCALADALATSCMAMTVDEAMAMFGVPELSGAEVLLVVADAAAKGGYRIVTSPGFPMPSVQTP